MSKSSIFKEIGLSPIEGNSSECYEKGKSDNKTLLLGSDVFSLERKDKRKCGYTDNLKCGDFESSGVGKKFTSYDGFPSLRSDIYLYLERYFVKNAGPSLYDYYLEMIYDGFRAEKIKYKMEGKWNLKGLQEYLDNIKLEEYLPKPRRESSKEACDPAVTDEYEEYLCNICHGMTLDEYRAWSERDPYFDYWPGRKDITSFVTERKPDIEEYVVHAEVPAKEEIVVLPQDVDLDPKEKSDEQKSFEEQDEKCKPNEKNTKKKKKKGWWKRFLACFNCFKCVKSKEEE